MPYTFIEFHIHLSFLIFGARAHGLQVPPVHKLQNVLVDLMNRNVNSRTRLLILFQGEMSRVLLRKLFSLKNKHLPLSPRIIRMMMACSLSRFHQLPRIECIRLVKTRPSIKSFVVTGKTLVTVGGDMFCETVTSFQVSDQGGCSVKQGIRDRYTVYDVDVSNFRRVMATGNGEGRLSIFEVSEDSTLKGLTTVPNAHTSAILAVRFDSKLPGNILATASISGDFKLWELSSDFTLRSLLRLNGFRIELNSISFDPFSKMIAISSNIIGSDDMWLLKPVSDESYAGLTKAWSIVHNSIQCCTFHPSLPNILATAGKTNKIDDVKIWNVSSNRMSATLVANFTGHSKPISSIVFHPTAPILVTGSKDRKANLWLLDLNCSSAICIGTIMHESAVICVKIDENGVLISCSSNKQIKWSQI
jgi:WD40 repeat protein